MNDTTRAIVLSSIIGLGGGFTGAYAFFDQFAKKEDVELIRAEQQRRTATIYSVPVQLEEFRAAVKELSGRVRSLELEVKELRTDLARPRGFRAN